MATEEFEKVELTLPTSEYAMVIFHNTQESYQTESDVECAYIITPNLQPSKRDWVGVYKVGWRSARDYVCFDWSTIPDDYTAGDRLEMSVTFKANCLPKDDGDFYQFCYVTSTGHIRGASTPFQFRRPGSEDFVEVEDEEDEDIVVIKGKTTMLEDALSKAEGQREELTKKLECLEKERDSLVERLIKTEKLLQKEKEEHDATTSNLQTQMKEVNHNLESQREAKEELQLLHSSVQEKVTVLNQEKETWVKRLDDNDAYIKSLQEKIKALINEKDALTGQKKALEEEKELYKCHFTSSEDQVKSYLVEIETLRHRSNDSELKRQDLKREVLALTAELKEEREMAEGHKDVIDCKELQLAEVTEKLKNSEDKLEAADHCKQLLNEEVSTLKQTFEKLSVDLEQSKSEAHSFKTQLGKQKDVTQTYVERLEGLQRTLGMKEQELKDCQQECVKAKQMTEENKIQQRVEEDGSLFALKLAYNSLSDRYEKVKATRDEVKGHLEESLAKARALEEEKLKLEEDCHKRLRLAQEEYEKRVVECRRLQAELRRALRTSNDGKTVSKVELHRQRSTSTGQAGAASCEDKVETSDDQVACGSTGGAADISETPDLASAGHSSANISLMEQTTSELQGQLSNLGEELEKRQAKKMKYKKLYQEEKEQKAFLQQHYFSELSNKDAEIERLKAEVTELKQDCEERVRTLEDMLEEQKIHIRQEQMISPQGTPVYPPQAPGYPLPPFLPPTTHPHHPQPFYPPQQPPMPHHPAPFPMSHGHPFPLPPPLNYPPRLAPALTPRDVTTVTHPDYPAQMTPQPAQATAADPALHTDCAAEDNICDDLDPLNNTDNTPCNLDPPLQPLPPPLSPTKSFSAMALEVRAISAGVQTPVGDETEDAGITGAVGGVDDEDEDRFHDAEEGPTQHIDMQGVANPLSPTAPLTEAEPQRVTVPPTARQVPVVTPPATRHITVMGPPSITDASLRSCPVCMMVFTPSTHQDVINQHVETHMEKICPVCGQMFDEELQQQYAQHVQSHFDE